MRGASFVPSSAAVQRSPAAQTAPAVRSSASRSKSLATGRCQGLPLNSVNRRSERIQTNGTANGSATRRERPTRRPNPAGRANARSRRERWTGIVAAKNARSAARSAKPRLPPSSSEPWKKSNASGIFEHSVGMTEERTGAATKATAKHHGSIIHGPVSTSRTRSPRESFARSLSLPARKRRDRRNVFIGWWSCMAVAGSAPRHAAGQAGNVGHPTGTPRGESTPPRPENAFPTLSHNLENSAPRDINARHPEEKRTFQVVILPCWFNLYIFCRLGSGGATQIVRMRALMRARMGAGTGVALPEGNAGKAGLEPANFRTFQHATNPRHLPARRGTDARLARGRAPAERRRRSAGSGLGSAL